MQFLYYNSCREKFGAKKKELFLILVYLEKVFDHVPREAIPWALRRQKVPEHLAVCPYIANNARTRVSEICLL